MTQICKSLSPRTFFSKEYDCFAKFSNKKICKPEEFNLTKFRSGMAVSPDSAYLFSEEGIIKISTIAGVNVIHHLFSGINASHVSNKSLFAPMISAERCVFKRNNTTVNKAASIVCTNVNLDILWEIEVGNSFGYSHNFFDEQQLIYTVGSAESKYITMHKIDVSGESIWEYTHDQPGSMKIENGCVLSNGHILVPFIKKDSYQVGKFLLIDEHGNLNGEISTNICNDKCFDSTQSNVSILKDEDGNVLIFFTISFRYKNRNCNVRLDCFE